MILNREEIKNRKIIEPLNENRLGNASYDLSIDIIITMDGKKQKSGYKLKSQEIIWVICKEKFKMPKDILGIAHMKTAFTREGIFAMNMGIIDPRYEGKISTLLINFGKNSKSIVENDVVLRVTFAKVNEQNDNPEDVSIVKKDDIYLNEIIKSTDSFDNTFLNMKIIRKKWYILLKNKFINFLMLLAAILGIILSVKELIPIIKQIIQIIYG